MRIKLAAITKSKWDSLQFNSLKEQISISNRKIQKGVDLGIERVRLINACNTIQQEAFCSSDIISTISASIDIDSNLLKTPVLNKEDCIFVDQLKIDNLNDIGGFITLMDVFYGNFEITSSVNPPLMSFKFPELASFVDNETFRKNSLARKVRLAFLKGEPIGSSSKLARHSKLISELRDFIFYDKFLFNQVPLVRFAYEDGSIGEAFPLFCLINIDKPIANKHYNIGLISNRHHELDNVIDYYLIRNFEISKGEEVFISEQEKITFNKSLSFFEDLLHNEEEKSILQLNIYHTGLEASVIGAYRAIITILTNSKYRGKIIFKPFITEEKSLPEWY